MWVYYANAYGTGDGMEPDLRVSRSLDGIKLIAGEMLNYSMIDDDVDEQLIEAKRQVLGWDGICAIEVYYFDGNVGTLALGWTEMDDAV